MSSARLPLALLLLLMVPAWAGCAQQTATHAPAADAPGTWLLAIDGRWGFAAEPAEARLSAAGIAPAGRGALGEAILHGGRLPTLLDYAAFDATAAATLDAPTVVEGQVWLTRELATRAGVEKGSAVRLDSAAWTRPYVATFFEMERTPRCHERADAKLCFLPQEREGEARLRLRVEDGARDLAFLPDLVELGPTGTPAWWNGTFESPEGQTSAFIAFAPRGGEPVPAEFDGAMAAGEWTLRFRLEANGTLAPSGAAGIVRVREPGYLWFDDRYQQLLDPIAQARATLDNATPTRLDLRVAGLLDEPPLANAQALVSLADARRLGLLREGDATILLANATRALAVAHSELPAPDAVSQALRLRPLPAHMSPGSSEGPLVFAAPAGVRLDGLPAVAGAREPALATAVKLPIGEPMTLGEGALPSDALVLALASSQAPPWAPPADGRWPSVESTLENLSRSRTLVLASEDLLQAPVAAERVSIGEGTTARVVVAAGRLDGASSRTLWGAASLVHSLGHPALPRVLVPVEPGQDRDEVAARVSAAYAPHGLALHR